MPFELCQSVTYDHGHISGAVDSHTDLCTSLSKFITYLGIHNIVNRLHRFHYDIYHKMVPHPSSAGTFFRGPETCRSGIPCCRTWTCLCTGSTRLPETSRTTRMARPGKRSSATRCP